MTAIWHILGQWALQSFGKRKGRISRTQTVGLVSCLWTPMEPIKHAMTKVRCGAAGGLTTVKCEAFVSNLPHVVLWCVGSPTAIKFHK